MDKSITPLTNIDRFQELIEDTLNKSSRLLLRKSSEYATNTDLLHNFNVAARLANTTPETALRGMLAKHIVSVWDYVSDTENGRVLTRDEWDEKIIDVINYMVLLRVMIHNKAENEPTQIDATSIGSAGPKSVAGPSEREQERAYRKFFEGTKGGLGKL